MKTFFRTTGTIAQRALGVPFKFDSGFMLELGPQPPSRFLVHEDLYRMFFREEGFRTVRAQQE